MVGRVHPVHFNSIKVRLELTRDKVRAVVSAFQFHKGAIRTLDKAYALTTDYNFNSIKVRLEQSDLI